MSEASSKEPIQTIDLDPHFWEEIQDRMGGESLSHCLTCGTCTAGCLVREVDPTFNPRRLVHQVILGMKEYFLKHPEVPYACNLCGLCAQNCPYGINIGDLCMALREWLVDQGVGPLPRHKMMRDDLAFVTSDDYTISLPDPDTGTCERVFFPGCNMPAYSPELVLEAWRYLRQRLPGTGIVLRCCGALAHDLGLHGMFGELSDILEGEVDKLGAKELITGCPDCYQTIKHTHPTFRLRNLYEVLEEVGIPDDLNGNGYTFTLHDSCKARWEPEMQQSVRELLGAMVYKIEELSYTGELTRCCGQGGLTIALNPFRVINLTKLRIADAHYDMLSYCAACRETFAMHRPSLHVLDLLFNPNWEEVKSRSMTPPKQRRENQLKLKSILESM
jgi:Fe-S oxidoreductase